MDLIWPSLLCLTPAVVAGWTGRAFLRSLDRPHRAERWKKRSETVGATYVYAGVAMPFFTEWWLAFFALSLLLGTFFGYQIHKRVFSETWSYPAYFLHLTRTTFALSGQTLLVATCPWIMKSLVPAEYGLSAGGAITLGFLIWTRNGILLTKWLLGSQPIQDAGLNARLDEVLQRSRVPSRVRVVTAGAPGGRWAAAFALPGTDESLVILGRTLLEKLDQREVMAVFAHEVAHLESWTKARVLREAYLILLPLAVVAVFLTPAVQHFSPDLGPFAAPLWFVGVLAFYSYRRAGRQSEEFDSDLRGAELVGEREAMASALEKVHSLNFLPRQLDNEEESVSSHPSLERRLQLLRQSSVPEKNNGAPAPTTSLGVDLNVSEPVPNPAFRVPLASGGHLSLEDEAYHRVRVDREAGIERKLTSVRYDGLVDLQLVRDPQEGFTLRSVDGDGLENRYILEEGHPERLAQLERVIAEKGQLLSPPNPRQQEGTALRQLFPTFAIVLSVLILLDQFSFALAAILLVAIFRPGSASLAAAGMATLAALLLRVGSDFKTGPVPVSIILVAAISTVVLAIYASGSTPSRRAHGLRPTLLVCGFPAGWAFLGALSILVGSASFAAAPRVLLTTSWGIMSASGALAALMVAGYWRWAAPTGLLVAVWSIIAVPSFSRIWSNDVRFAAQPFELRTLPWPPPVARAEFPGTMGRRILVSPDGSTFAVSGEWSRHRASDNKEPFQPGAWLVGDFESHSTIAATELRFIDSGRLAALQLTPSAAVVSVLRLHDGSLELLQSRTLWGFSNGRFAETATSAALAVYSLSPWRKDLGLRLRVAEIDPTDLSRTSSRTFALKEPISASSVAVTKNRWWIVGTRLPNPNQGSPLAWLRFMLHGFRLRSELLVVTPRDGSIGSIFYGNHLRCTGLQAQSIFCIDSFPPDLVFMALDTGTREVRSLGRLRTNIYRAQRWQVAGAQALGVGYDHRIQFVDLEEGWMTEWKAANEDAMLTLLLALAENRMIRVRSTPERAIVEAFDLPL